MIQNFDKKKYYLFYQDNNISYKIFKDLQPKEFIQCYEHLSKNTKNVSMQFTDSNDLEYISLSNYLNSHVSSFSINPELREFYSQIIYPPNSFNTNHTIKLDNTCPNLYQFYNFCKSKLIYQSVAFLLFKLTTIIEELDFIKNYGYYKIQKSTFNSELFMILWNMFSAQYYEARCSQLNSCKCINLYQIPNEMLYKVIDYLSYHNIFNSLIC